MIYQVSGQQATLAQGDPASKQNKNDMNNNQTIKKSINKLLLIVWSVPECPLPTGVAQWSGR